MPDNLDQINVTTRRYIDLEPKLSDFIYNQDALNAMLRKQMEQKFTGGSSINEDFIYDSMPGGGYLKGKTFSTPQKQTEQQLRWDMKYMEIAVTLYQEDIEVLNTGPAAFISILKSRVDQAYMSLGAYVSIATYLNGVDAGYTANLNGLTEALSDGSTNGWNAATYATYGSLTRATYSPTLNSKPVAVTNGSIEYNTIDATYMDAFYGSGTYEPNLLVTTPIGYSYIKSKFQTQQRFQEVSAPDIGFRGLSINGATLVASRYCPGSYLSGSSGLADKVAVNYLTETSNGDVTAYPSSTGETLFILNARKPFLKYYVAPGRFGGGFRDFVPTGNNTVLTGLVLLGHQLTVQPRYHRYIYGFTG